MTLRWKLRLAAWTYAAISVSFSIFACVLAITGWSSPWLALAIAAFAGIAAYGHSKAFT